MPRSTRSTAAAAAAQHRAPIEEQRQSTRLQDRGHATSRRDADAMSVLASLPSSRRPRSRPAQLADETNTMATNSRRNKRQRKGSNSATVSKKKNVESRPSWEDCSTDDNDQDTVVRPAIDQESLLAVGAPPRIPTVTPASTTALVSRVTRASSAESTSGLRLELEEANRPQKSSSLSSSSSGEQRRRVSSLPNGVVDLYPRDPERHTTCHCGQDDCSSHSLTADFLATYGKEYFDHLRGSGDPILRQEQFRSDNMPERSDLDCSSETDSSEPSSDDFPTRSVRPIMGFPHEDEDDVETLASRPQISPKMRAILVDWLIELSEEFKMAPDTLHLAVSLVDRAFANDSFTMERDELQCLGCSCMWIAGKIEEIKVLTVKDFVYISDNLYTAKQIADMEMRVCTALHFRLNAVTPYHYLSEFLRASYACSNLSCCRVTSSRSYKQLRFLALYLLELSLLPYEFQQLRPKLIASAAVYLARATLGMRGKPSEATVWSPQAIWTKTLQHYTGYTVLQLEETVLTLHRYQRAAGESQLKSVFVKYGRDEFINVAFKTALPVGDLGLY